MTLAQRVKDYRYSKGWGTEELSSRAAISRTTLRQIESGTTGLPHASTLQRIALALGVSMEVLVSDSITKPPGKAPRRLAVARSRPLGSEWKSAEEAALNAHTCRPGAEFDRLDGSEFAVEPIAARAHVPLDRERDLALMLQELLGSPFGDAVARVLDETYRLLRETSMVDGDE